MKVKELIQKLQRCDQNAVVVIHGNIWGYTEITSLEKPIRVRPYKRMDTVMHSIQKPEFSQYIENYLVKTDRKTKTIKAIELNALHVSDLKTVNSLNEVVAFNKKHRFPKTVK